MSLKNREFSPEFRIGVAKRMVAGESVTKLHAEYEIKRSVLYRWRDAYRKDGTAGLQRAIGRPPGVPNPAPKPRLPEEERLRQQVAALERKVGQQALHLDFFKRAFKRVKESSQTSGSTGAAASTGRSAK
jgi:transposase-like protein